MVDNRFGISGIERWVSACTILAILLFPGVSLASKISLELSVEIKKNDKNWTGHVLVTNRGDEAAYELQATLRVLEDEKRSSIVKQLEVGKTWEAGFQILEGMESQLIPGKYPVIVHVFYSDSNGHPFSALAVDLFEFHEAFVSQISGDLRTTPISGNGKLILELQNMDETPTDVSVHWVLPRELVLDRAGETIKMNGRDSTVIKRRVRNLSALPGSQYPVCALIEYDKDGRHFSSKAMAALNIVEPVSLVRSIRVPLFVVFGILVVMVIVHQVRHSRHGKGI